jgi:uncharacterized membrane protein YhaH (DUF805 family)
MARALDLRGRIGREEYSREAISLQVGAWFSWVVVLAAAALGSPWWTLALACVLPLLLAAFAMASFAVAVRRMHDLGASGWWVLLGYGARVGALVLLFIGVALRVSYGVPTGLALALGSEAMSLALLQKRGEASANRYGEPPSAREASVPVVVEATKPRDLDAELRAERADLERTKTQLTR